MLNKLKNTLIASAFLVLPVAALAPVAVVSAQNIQENLCGGANFSVDPQDCADEGGENAQSLINTIVDIFSLIVGFVSVIMIIYGGFRYITSGGDSNGVTAAKNTILYAVIGLIIVALAQVIVNFVLNQADPNA